MKRLQKIPENAKKVFAGKLFDVYQWEQEMFDGSKEIFEAIKRNAEAVTIFAVTEDKKILINFEEQPHVGKFIALPGGGAEGEDPEIAAQRELLEETGYTSSDWSYLFSEDIYEGTKAEYLNHFYLAKNCVKTHEQDLDTGEKIETVPHTLDEFLKLIEENKLRNKDFVRRFRKNIIDTTDLREFLQDLFK